MAKGAYIKPGDAAFLTQMETFEANIGSYAMTLGVSAARIAEHKDDMAYLRYVLSCQSVTQNCAEQWTIWKDILREGGVLPTSGSPVPPSFPANVAPVAAGIESRFRALAQDIKKHANYNASIGSILNIEGDEKSGPDLLTLQPEFKVNLKGGQVFIGWGWNGFSAHLDVCEIQVDRGDGQGYRLLTFDTTPGYTDTEPLPTTPAKWTYRAIYRIGDDRVGQWSLPVSIHVGA